LGDRVLPEAGCGEQLLGAVLGTGEDRAGLCTRPLERLLDLGAGRVRQLGGLMTRLLEETVPLRLRLLQLACCIGVRAREELARLVPGGIQHLRPLTLALLAVPLDFRLA